MNQLELFNEQQEFNFECIESIEVCTADTISERAEFIQEWFRYRIYSANKTREGDSSLFERERRKKI